MCIFFHLRDSLSGQLIPFFSQIFTYVYIPGRVMLTKKENYYCCRCRHCDCDATLSVCSCERAYYDAYFCLISSFLPN